MHGFRAARAPAWLALALALTLLVLAPSRLNANGWPKTLVRVDDAAVRAEPDSASPVLARLRAHEPVGVAEERSGWCRVVAPAGRLEGWMKAADLVRSAGMARFWARQFAEALQALSEESRSENDPVVSSWLRFYAAYCQWATGRLDDAAATFEVIAGHRPPTAFVPLACVAAAKVHYVRGDLDSAVRAYEKLLATSPGFELNCSQWPGSAVDPYPVAWTNDAELCLGNPSIAARLSALGALMGVQATVNRVRDDPAATPEAKASAWVDLGRAWEEKNRVDPGRTELEGMITVNSDATRCFEAAVTVSPGSRPAGFAADRLISLSEPYEWEGDYKAQATWMLEKYGTFLASFPTHELSGEAMFKMGIATWALAGYPELFRIIFISTEQRGSGLWTALQDRSRELEQWFDMRGFGGGLGSVTPVPSGAAKALAAFQDLLSRYPATKSAGMARYYCAVILDFCLGDRPKALAEYKAFVSQYPQIELFVEKARRRIAALQTVK